MTRFLRILHLASSKRWTGVAEPMINMAFYQKAMGHEVRVGCSPGRSLELSIRKRGLFFVSGLRLSGRLNPLEIIADIRALCAIIKDFQPDVIHAHLLHDHWLACLSMSKFIKKPLLLRSLHRFTPPYVDPLHKWLLKNSTDGFIVPTESMKRLFASRYPQLENRVFTVYGGVNQERFHPGVPGNRIRSKYGISPDAPVAGVVSRLRKDRGIDWLLAALPQFLANLPDARFLIVGKGEMAREIATRVKAPPFDGRVIMTGYHSRDLPDVYAAMDASVFLALGSEGSCRAILEAMNVGRPVIGVKLDPVAEIIEEGVSGFLVPKNDNALLAQRLTRILSDIPHARTMGERARKTMREKYALWENISELVSIYNILLDKKLP